MITDQQFKEAAKAIGCKVSRIRAVYEIEAAGRGYLADGRVKILFEGHRFWKTIAKKGVPEKQIQEAAALYPSILYKKWTRKHYIGGAAEWDRMSQAYKVCDLVGLPAAIALEVASYGSFQIMGENHAMCGYGSAHEMLAAYNMHGEYEQLQSFIKFIKSKGLADHLIAGNWAKFAAGYNGTGYRLNKYDIKLAKADRKFSAADQ